MGWFVTMMRDWMTGIGAMVLLLTFVSAMTEKATFNGFFVLGLPLFSAWLKAEIMDWPRERR